MAESDIVGILLAAGRGNRFGGDKLLAPLADGTPMALAVARKLRGACRQTITVLRPEQNLMGEMLEADGCRIVYNHEADFGMGHSLAAAVRSAHDAGGWLIALADMPAISEATYSLIVVALRNGASLAAPFYQGRRGHPVGFSRTWLDHLICLQGDEGARRILAEHASSLTPVPSVDPGILVDVDTPEELAKLVGSKAGG